MNPYALADEAVLTQLGARIARHRLQKNMTQKVLAQEAGLSLLTIKNLEKGASVQLTNLIRVLRALKLLENIEALVPEIPVSPIEQLARKGKLRKRASSKKKKNNEDGSWTWGDAA